MSVILLEKRLFDKSIERVNKFLKVTGLDVSEEEPVRNIKWYSRKWFFYLNISCVVYNTFSQMAWGIRASLTGALTLTELTYLGPCLLLCVLGSTKSFNFFMKVPITHRLMKNLRDMYCNMQSLQGTRGQCLYMQSEINFLNRALNTLTGLDGLGIIAFSIGPIIIFTVHYYTKNELNLQLPFMLVYPFDPFNIYIWPFAYIHQIWSAIVAVFTVLGPDSLLYTSCVLVNVQFFYLKKEIESLFDNRVVSLEQSDEELKKKFANLINRHWQLLRCADLIETIYTESTLCNVLTSSLLICFTGFNVMAYHTFLVIAPFIAFLFMVIGQIYLLCYYGDLLQKSNAELCDAVYNSAWYKVKTSFTKNLFIICARAQKSCQLTAYGFVDINMAAFTRIISTSWSYFALLWSLLKKN